jgi:hypothetical protein
MGTLHNVYQLKPRATYGGAFLKVKAEKADTFMHELEAYINTHFTDSWNPSNMDLQVSEDGNVLIHGMNQEDRTVDLQHPGTYVLIQSGNKHGFNSDFTACLNQFSDRFEDSLFYIVWDDDMQSFEIRDGHLQVGQFRNMKQWNYRFEEYLQEQYASDPQLLTDSFVDYLLDLKATADNMPQYDSNLDEYFDREEYEEMLEKLERYTETTKSEYAPEMIAWLKDRIANYKPVN